MKTKKNDLDTSPEGANNPYEERTCHICQRPVSELEPFDWPDNPTIGSVSGMKLFKSYRWDFPYHVGSTRECRDCVGRPEPIWWILAEEKRLERRLTFPEVNEVRHKWNLEAKKYDLELSLEAMDEKREQEEERLGRRLTDPEKIEIQREFNLVETTPEGGLTILELREESNTH